VQLNRAGRLHRIREKEVNTASKKHKLEELCCSNDQHVVAVALASGCRLIFSRDKNLHKDVQNKHIMTPSASIYQSKD